MTLSFCETTKTNSTHCWGTGRLPTLATSGINEMLLELSFVATTRNDSEADASTWSVSSGDWNVCGASSRSSGFLRRSPSTGSSTWPRTHKHRHPPSSPPGCRPTVQPRRLNLIRIDHQTKAPRQKRANELYMERRRRQVGHFEADSTESI